MTYSLKHCKTNFILNLIYFLKHNIRKLSIEESSQSKMKFLKRLLLDAPSNQNQNQNQQNKKVIAGEVLQEIDSETD